MKKYVFVLVVLFLSCEGRLSDEQRKQMKEQMDLHKIKRVTDAEITAAAFEKGRSVIRSFEAAGHDSTKIDSILKSYGGKVRWIVPGKGNALALEQQLVDAYLADESGSVQDNVQKLRNAEGESDSLLYTKPVITRMDDGVEKLEGVWNIWLSKKELILAMNKK
jgi:hypothetical protein